jgi:hypothetical protein
MKNLNTKITYEMVPVDLLNIDTYQRNLNPGWVMEIANDFDMAKAGVPVASLRNGIYHVIDGQHRLSAARIAGVPMLMCQIIHDVTHEGSATLFKDLNKNRKRTSPYDNHRAGVEAKDPDSLGLEDVVNKNGIDISRGRGENRINAVQTIVDIYKKYGYDHLDITLRLIKATWDGESISFKEDMINGVSAFVNIYKDDIKENVFIAKLQTVGIVRIERTVADNCSARSRDMKIVHVLFGYYNLFLRKNKLTDKHSDL